MAGCGADTEANALIAALTTDATFPIPNVDFSGDEFKFPEGTLNAEVKPLTVADLTTGAIDGPGVFDALMRGFKAHLTKEFEDGRITGNDYTKAYIALTESAMSQGIAFLLGKDNAFWQSTLARLQAFTARVQLEETKIRVAATQYDAANQKATYALTKMRMSTESAQYCLVQVQKDTAEYQLVNLLPINKAMAQSQKEGQDTSNRTAEFNLSEILSRQSELLEFQKEQANTEWATAKYNLDVILVQQNQNMMSQNNLIREQVESQRAQTQDNRSDGAQIYGVLGKQKELYAQQITSYQRDSEMKVAKIFSDAWITQKTIDEGLTPPNNFTNGQVDQVLQNLRTKSGM